MFAVSLWKQWWLSTVDADVDNRSRDRRVKQVVFEVELCWAVAAGSSFPVIGN